MALNGRDLLLTVRTSTGPDVYTVIGSQTGAKVARKCNDLDTSSKDSFDATALAGRRTREITCDSLLVPTDAAYLALEAAYDNGTLCRVRTTAIGGRAAKTGDCVLTELGEDFGDDKVMMTSVKLKVSGTWN